MKRLFSILLILVLALSLAFTSACRENDDKKYPYEDDDDGKWTPSYSIVRETKI